MKVLITVLLWLSALGLSKMLGLAVLFKILLWAGMLFAGAIVAGLVVCVVATLYWLIKKKKG